MIAGLMRGIAVANLKGGVGKTTTAIHLASGLARRGHRTLLVDADPQANATFAFDVHAPLTLRDVLLDRASASDAIVHDVEPRLDFLATDVGAFGLETQLSSAMQRETILARRLQALTDYDVVVFDTSPAMGLLTYNALLAATEVIIPVTMDPLAVLGARETLRGIREIRKLWPDRALPVTAVLPVNVQSARVATRAAMQALEDDHELRSALIRPGIRQCADLVYAMAARRVIWDLAPRSRAAREYDGFIDTIVAATTQRGAHETTAQTPAVHI